MLPRENLITYRNQRKFYKIEYTEISTDKLIIRPTSVDLTSAFTIIKKLRDFLILEMIEPRQSHVPNLCPSIRLSITIKSKMANR